MKSPVYILYDDDRDDVDNEVVNILLITDSDFFLTSLLRCVDEIKTILLPYNWNKSQVVLLGIGVQKIKDKTQGMIEHKFLSQIKSF